MYLEVLTYILTYVPWRPDLWTLKCWHTVYFEILTYSPCVSDYVPWGPDMFTRYTLRSLRTYLEVLTYVLWDHDIHTLRSWYTYCTLRSWYTYLEILTYVPWGPDIPTLRSDILYIPLGPHISTYLEVLTYLPWGPDIRTLRSWHINLEVLTYICWGPDILTSNLRSWHTYVEVLTNVPWGHDIRTLRSSFCLCHASRSFLQTSSMACRSFNFLICQTLYKTGTAATFLIAV